MLAVADIVPGLLTTRADFAELFLRAQAHMPGQQRQAFNVVTQQADDAAAFTEALQDAAHRGFLDDFLNLVVSDGLAKGALVQALAEDAASPAAAQLQAITSKVRGFVDPETWQRGFANGTRWTVRVLIDRQFMGTGVLVSPNMVLTAWHVVRSLFKLKSGQYEPEKGAQTASRLGFEFDDFLTHIGRAGRQVPGPVHPAKAHEDWCFKFSACHAEELLNRLPADITQLEAHWDYALLRVTPPPGLERRWAPLRSTSAVPKKGDWALVFGHPAGQRLQADPGKVCEMTPSTPATARLRFLHDTNTENGSSGGPCFDKEFELFGLHQGVWQKDGGGATVINRGVPILRVLEDIKEFPPLDPGEAPVWNRGKALSYAPVIAREKFQGIVWRSMTAEKPRVIVLDGEQGVGKSFCLDLLAAMLPESGHLQVTVPAGLIGKLDPLAIATKLCDEASATLGPITPQERYSSTPTVWLRDHVAESVVAALDRVRQRRTVWICIRDLNRFGIETQPSADLMHILYERTRGSDWLRFVLDGMQAELPVTLEDLAEEYEVPAVTLEDLKTLMRRYNAEFQIGMTELTIQMLTKPPFERYRKARRTEFGPALTALVNEITGTIDVAVREQTEG